MKSNINQTNKYEETMFFNTLALNSIIGEEDITLRDSLKDVINDIITGKSKIIAKEYKKESLEFHLQNEGKKQYLRMYSDGDYILLTDTF